MDVFIFIFLFLFFCGVGFFYTCILVDCCLWYVPLIRCACIYMHLICMRTHIHTYTYICSYAVSSHSFTSHKSHLLLFLVHRTFSQTVTCTCTYLHAHAPTHTYVCIHTGHEYTEIVHIIISSLHFLGSVVFLIRYVPTVLALVFGY